ncbi:acyltransferase [Desulfoprunum benzoelyticum]|uniref:Peptidoglycan/LPS O-acetylase OafA/YrhL n=1 Tax=Desulfoprunum benzoelyticum TaxID=1506996 RepID=A0A840USL5_9BACT|nr:acyltransferase [Desulfoprunum benzoelyticum]MBB5347723.1 peptidoglycan/LPS O-acetylase OafA/YrhL [Desulfoprunum benzoelyticum]MBM9529316.1 acyltransferase [Desulfoprunum benzoelyticum]
MPKERLYYLDFIRVFATLLIILFHYNVWTERLVSADFLLVRNYTFLGEIGVSLFLILSGASLAQSTKGDFDVPTFYSKRIRAIFPMFYLVYATFMGLALVLHQYQFSAERSPFAFALTLIGLDGLLSTVVPTYYLVGEWFLGCIIVLYLIYPAIRHCFVKNDILTLTLCAAVVLLLQHHYTLTFPLQRLPLFRLAEFVFGMFFLTRFSDNRPVGHLLIALAAMILLSASTFDFQSLGSITMNIYGMVVFVGIAYAVRFAPWKPLRPAISFLSRYAYPAFLVHHIILKQTLIAGGRLIHSVAANLFVFVLVVIVVYLAAYAFAMALAHLPQPGRILSYIKATSGQRP